MTSFKYSLQHRLFGLYLLMLGLGQRLVRSMVIHYQGGEFTSQALKYFQRSDKVESVQLGDRNQVDFVSEYLHTHQDVGGSVFSLAVLDIKRPGFVDREDRKGVSAGCQPHKIVGAVEILQSLFH